MENIQGSVEMTEVNAKIETAVLKMLEKSDDCLELAKAESQSAVEQHESAARQRKDADRLASHSKMLAGLGRSLEKDAMNLRDGLDVRSAVVPRT